MVTVRQLLELMDKDDFVVIFEAEKNGEEYRGNVEHCFACVPNAVLDSSIVYIYPRSECELYIYREVRK